MQKANLSYVVAQGCIDQLKLLGLIELAPETLAYATTKKGIVFLEKWTQLQEFLSPKERVSISAGKASSPFGAPQSEISGVTQVFSRS